MTVFGKKRLAIGTEDFEKLRRAGCYYVDKTGLIAELMRSMTEVTLFTRPRRFGKTLNMSMLKCFFEIGGDPALFDGLKISKDAELCEQYMGRFPVFFISLKDVGADSFARAKEQMASVIADAVYPFKFLLNSAVLDDSDKELLRELTNRRMDEQMICDSLRILTRLLAKHYGCKAILLIDEYDVPLQKAFYGGYYEEMVQLVRSMFSQALKTNLNLEFAVLTGCLRISRESIFTGMNHLRVLTISDPRFTGYFGFSDAEVREMLEYYEVLDAYDAVKNWYDGYRFGDAEVYCPWDVINYIDLLRTAPRAMPQNFWANSSGNDVVTEFVKRLDASAAARELEQLAAGEAVMKEIRQELTYREMYDSLDNLWSLLYMTGYLTKRGEAEEEKIPLVIPNMEIRGIFKRQIMDLFKEKVAADGAMVQEFCGALLAGDAGKTEELLGKYLKMTVSIRDTFVRKSLKENFYHGILLGILGYKGDWYVTSNYETGDGYGDILIEPKEGDPGIVIEVKYAHDGDLEKGVRLAMEQINTRHYDAALHERGIRQVLKYGIACFRKECRVALEE